MRAQPWVDTFWTYASVHDGVVALHGFARSEVVHKGLKLLVQEVPGVKRVEDHTEPMPKILRVTL
jgi:osmotically-inducible protein OsmY